MDPSQQLSAVQGSRPRSKSDWGMHLISQDIRENLGSMRSEMTAHPRETQDDLNIDDVFTAASPDSASGSQEEDMGAKGGVERMETRGEGASRQLIIFPRRKAGQAQREPNNQAPVQLSLELLDEIADVPLLVAAKNLGISKTALKNACRNLGLERWPFRRRMEMARRNSMQQAGNDKRHPRVSSPINKGGGSRSPTRSPSRSGSRSPTRSPCRSPIIMGKRQSSGGTSPTSFRRHTIGDKAGSRFGNDGQARLESTISPPDSPRADMQDPPVLIGMPPQGKHHMAAGGFNRRQLSGPGVNFGATSSAERKALEVQQEMQEEEAMLAAQLGQQSLDDQTLDPWNAQGANLTAASSHQNMNGGQDGWWTQSEHPQKNSWDSFQQPNTFASGNEFDPFAGEPWQSQAQQGAEPAVQGHGQQQQTRQQSSQPDMYHGGMGNNQQGIRGDGLFNHQPYHSAPVQPMAHGSQPRQHSQQPHPQPSQYPQQMHHSMQGQHPQQQHMPQMQHPQQQQQIYMPVHQQAQQGQHQRMGMGGVPHTHYANYPSSTIDGHQFQSQMQSTGHQPMY